jgi:hypothetical protein
MPEAASGPAVLSVALRSLEGAGLTCNADAPAFAAQASVQQLQTPRFSSSLHPSQLCSE